MFKRYTYFFLPFLLYSTTYGMVMEALRENFLNLDYEALSYNAKTMVQALAHVLINFPNKERAEEVFKEILKDFTRDPHVQSMFVDNYTWDQIKQQSDLSILYSSTILQYAFKVVEDTRFKDENLSSKATHEKLGHRKTDILNEKEPKTLGNKSKKSNGSKKPTFLQKFSFGKIIAAVSILGAIMLLYHKHSKAQERPSQ